MTIKIKYGICPHCELTKKVPIYSKGFCQYHYWQNNKKVNYNKTQVKEKKETIKNNDIFYKKMYSKIPERCENCNVSLNALKKYSYKMILAHILPKRQMGGFPTVATNENNILFLCVDCHTKFDKKGKDYISKMSIIPLAKQRLNLFKHLLSDKDLERIPNYLK